MLVEQVVAAFVIVAEAGEVAAVYSSVAAAETQGVVVE